MDLGQLGGELLVLVEDLGHGVDQQQPLLGRHLGDKEERLESSVGLGVEVLSVPKKPGTIGREQGAGLLLSEELEIDAGDGDRWVVGLRRLTCLYLSRLAREEEDVPWWFCAPEELQILT